MASIVQLFPDGPPPRDEEPRSAGSAVVSRFRGRVHHRDRGCVNPFGRDDFDKCCPHCDWGAFVCAVCGSAEGEVPTDCPGRVMTEEERDGVLGGRLDYICGAGGWVRGRSRQGRFVCE